MLAFGMVARSVLTFARILAMPVLREGGRGGRKSPQEGEGACSLFFFLSVFLLDGFFLAPKAHRFLTTCKEVFDVSQSFS